MVFGGGNLGDAYIMKVIPSQMGSVPLKEAPERFPTLSHHTKPQWEGTIYERGGPL